MVKFEADRVEDLFTKDGGINMQAFKDPIVSHIKQNILIGIPETRISIDLEPSDDSDILIKVIDPEKALGYQVHADLDEYYQALSRELYVPQESDFNQGEG